MSWFCARCGVPRELEDFGVKPCSECGSQAITCPKPPAPSASGSRLLADGWHAAEA